MKKHGHFEACTRFSIILIFVAFCLNFFCSSRVMGAEKRIETTQVITIAKVINSDPFGSAAEVVVNIENECMATITICTPMDDVVRRWESQLMKPGQHIIRWDGRNNSGHEVASGVYFFKIETQHCKRVETLAFLR